jgi:hypothetical protein
MSNELVNRTARQIGEVFFPKSIPFGYFDQEAKVKVFIEQAINEAGYFHDNMNESLHKIRALVEAKSEDVENDVRTLVADRLKFGGRAIELEGFLKHVLTCSDGTPSCDACAEARQLVWPEPEKGAT